jgi:diaminopimelate epimerase
MKMQLENTINLRVYDRGHGSWQESCAKGVQRKYGYHTMSAKAEGVKV